MRPVIAVKGHGHLKIIQRHVWKMIEFYTQHIDGPAGKPVIFLPGAFQSIKTVQGIANILATYQSVIIVELPIARIHANYGAEDNERMEAKHALLDSILAYYKIDHAGIIGASFGGITAYTYAGSRPDRISSMSLFGIVDRLPPAQASLVNDAIQCVLKKQTAEFVDISVRSLMALEQGETIPRFPIIKRQLERSLARLTPEERWNFITSSREVLETNLSDLAPAPKCPSTVFSGEHDGFTTIESVHALAKRLPNAHAYTVKDADHLCHLEHPHECARLLMEVHIRPDKTVFQCNLL